MKLKEGLLKLLNNNDEPLPKRLKIADNAFKSPEVKIPNRELFLLKWLAQNEISKNNIESWEQCCSWLSSDSFRELRSSDLASTDIKLFLQTVTTQFQSENETILNTMVLVVGSMIESPLFQHYFQINLNEYLEFLKNITENCGYEQPLIKFWTRHDKIFAKKIITVMDFHDLFVNILYPSFVNVLTKFEPGDAKLFQCLSTIVQKNVFMRRQDDFLNCFSKLWSKTDDETLNIEILNVLTDKLLVTKKTKPVDCYYAHLLLYNAFCFSCDKLRIANVSAQLDCSLLGVVALLEVISSENLKFTTAINDLTFQNLLQNLLLSIISITKTPVNVNCYKILDLIVKINPLTIETCISQVLVYLMCHGASNELYAAEYTQTMCNIFEVFSKLHRIQNLISKIIRTLQPIYLENDSSSYSESLKSDFEFSGKISKSLKEQISVVDCDLVELDVTRMLPDLVLVQFSAATVGLATKQVSNLFKTFTFHLDALIGDDLAEKSKKTSYVSFIELINRLLCHYLERMNIAAGNFRAANVVDKITKHMQETQTVLEKFGQALLGIEHNQNLMRVFLQLSYVYGELKILIEHAIINDKQEAGLEEIEVRDDNLSFLQTWGLIAERISNFGEKECKKIMQKLSIQKIRILILSGTDSNVINEQITSLITTMAPIDDYYEYLVTNEFASQAILSQMDSETLVSIADCVLKSGTQKSAILSRVIESRHFVSALVYSVFKKMNKTLKKEAKNKGYDFISCKVFHQLGDLFINNQEIDVEALNLKDFFDVPEQMCVDGGENITFDKFIDYFAFIQQLPIVYMDKQYQLLMFYYLLGVLLDVRDICEGCEELETLLLGFFQMKIISLDVLPIKTIVNTVITKFGKPQDLFLLLLSNKATDRANLVKTLDVLKKNLDNDDYIKCLLVFVKYLQKYKKSPEILNSLQKPLIQLCDSLVKFLSTESENTSIYLEILIESINNGKIQISETISQVLQNQLLKIFNETKKITQGELVLFNFAFVNETIRSEEDDFVSNVAKCLGSHDLQLDKNMIHVFSTNVLAVLQKCNNLVEFKVFLEKILQRVIKSMDHLNMITLEMQVWHHILSSSMKAEKAEILQKSIEELLVTLFLTIEKGTSNKQGGINPITKEKEVLLNVLIDFELHLLQNTQHLLTSTTLDFCFATITQRMITSDDIEVTYKRSIDLLEVMLKHRQAIVCDRLSVFLQNYRQLLRALCDNSDTNNKQFDDKHFDKMAELAHLLEKLTINLCRLQAHLASIAIYVIADIIKEYETITIYPAVKLALNNCLYNLISLCNQHGIACLMRVLSPGSTEIFKVVYDNYKKYHRFTGKV